VAFAVAAAATLGIIVGRPGADVGLAVAGVAALLAAHPTLFHAACSTSVPAYLAWIGLKLLFAKPGGCQPVHPHRRRALLLQAKPAFITLLNPKAIVFYMAFFPLFINPATHQRMPSPSRAMAVTIALITAVYCLLLVRLRAGGQRPAHARATAAWRSALETAGRPLPDRLRHQAWATQMSAARHRDPASSASPTRRAASARPPPPSTWQPAWPWSASVCWWSTSTRRAMPPWARASTSAGSPAPSTTCCSARPASAEKAASAARQGGY
jgi:leucine efflux protein